MNKKATELLKQYGFERIKAADMIDSYNFEDRKLVEIVKATYFNPKIVVIDETTTALSQEGREELYKHMERIRKACQGKEKERQHRHLYFPRSPGDH